ncbi:hypothetical protein [Aquabacterium humicola]|uniref:hypothetical protein n=1 Tax=Aquabacterium humicola TaxID=3237377 RepID=UPI0025434F42|nr:hypothetical protein [Rubrivivax pictus]
MRSIDSQPDPTVPPKRERSTATSSPLPERNETVVAPDDSVTFFCGGICTEYDPNGPLSEDWIPLLDLSELTVPDLSAPGTRADDANTT